MRKLFFVCMMLFALGVCAQQSNTLSFADIKKDAEKGDVTSQTILGIMYYNGQGTTKNYSEAFKWFKKSAEQGDVNAQYLLAGMYDDGEGVKKNYSEAFKWYKKAAEQGNAAAQAQVGVMYYEGKGVAKDELEAYNWAQKASDQGNKIGTLLYNTITSKVAHRVVQSPGKLDVRDYFITPQSAPAQSATKTQNTSKTPSTTKTQRASTTKTSQKTTVSSSAKTLQQRANEGDADAMQQLGEAYHTGTTKGIKRDDFLSFYWLMRTYHALNEEQGENILDYIEKELVPKEVQDSFHDRYRKIRELNPNMPYDNSFFIKNEMESIQLFQHPLALLPTCMVYKSTSDMVKECKTRRKWDADLYKKKSLNIYESKNEMPSLFGHKTWNMSLYQGGKKYVKYDYSFKFDNYDDAAMFLYRYAYDMLQRGIVYTNFGIKTAKGVNENVSLSADSHTQADGKYAKVQHRLSLHTLTYKSIKYNVLIEFVITRK